MGIRINSTINNIRSKFHFFLIILSISNCFLVLPSCKLFSGKDSHNKNGLDKEYQYLNTSIFIEATKEKILGNHKEALQLYGICIKNDPNNAAAFYEIASIYTSNNQYKDALPFAKKATEIDKENVWYMLLYARLLLENKSDEEAFKVYEKLIKYHPDNIDYIYELALAYNSSGKYMEVVETYDRLEKLVGFSEELSIQKYKIYAELKKEDKAFDELQKLIDKFPGEAKYCGMLADYYMQLNKPDKAIEIYNEILKTEPDNALIRLSLSNYYRVKGDSINSFENLKLAFSNQALDIDSKVKILFNYYLTSEENASLTKEAFELAKILVKTHPDNPKSHAIYADFLYRENKFTEAKEEYFYVLSLDSSKYIIWEQALFCISELKDFRTMEEISSRGLQLFVEQPLLYLMNGMANYQLKNYPKAVTIFKQGLFWVVGNNLLKSQFYSYLGDSYYKLNKNDSSDYAYDKALQADPNNIDVLNNYSYYLSLRNEYLDKAEMMAKKANQLKPGNSSFLDTHAWVLYKMGNYSEAKIKIDEAIKSGGINNAIIWEHKGDIEFKLGNSQEALNCWDKAKSIGKGSDFLDKKISDRKLYE
jgi:tetratricopeptide (TPR) repeat protein